MNNIRRLCACALALLLLAGGGAAASGAPLQTADGRPLVESGDFAGSGDFDELNGDALLASFRHPAALTVLPDGSLAVADTVNQRIRLVKDGEVSVLAGTEVTAIFDDAGLPAGSYLDGEASLSFFELPGGIDADASGNVYVADTGNHAIRKISADGQVTTVAGNGVLGLADGAGTEASFYAPQDVAVAADGTVYVADTLNHVIRKIDPSGRVTTLNALSERVVELFEGVVETAGDFRDGPLAEALFNEPAGLALDASGNLYVSDMGNQRIRYVDFAAGTVTTVAGGGEYAENALYVEGFYVDGAAEEARFYSPQGIAVDAAGGLFIADSLNHSIRYLKDGKVVTVVGNAAGNYGSRNGVDEFALVDHPMDVAVAPDGSLLIADTYNNKIRAVRYYALPEGWAANGDIRVLYNNEEIGFDVKPLIRSNRTMVPVRKIAEALGYDVAFEANNIVLTGANRTVTLTVGKQEVVRETAAGTVVSPTDVAPFVEGDRTFVPVRFFAEQIRIDVDWDPATSTVILRDAAR